jgi:glutamine cyclotransferase
MFRKIFPLITLAVFAVFILVLTPLLFTQQTGGEKKPLVLTTVAAHPHDKDAFTQGLLFDGGTLYESTGQYGKSSLRQVEIKTGKILKRVRLPEKFFAEGIEQIGDKIYQLTWEEGYCFVYDKKTFELVEQHRYHGEGWGLTYDGTNLAVSNGSEILTFYEPKTFKKVRTVKVLDTDAKTKRKYPVKNLNELEFVRGEIWANVWHSNYIVRIDPQTGGVNGWIDLTNFVPAEYRTGRNESVLNGIAFDAATDTIYFTGKNWGTIFELKIGK